jgi:hypothetical protein
MQKTKSINITALAQQYGPGYVAKDKKSGRIIASSKRVDTLMKKVKDEIDKKTIVISWIPKHGARYVFNISVFVRPG